MLLKGEHERSQGRTHKTSQTYDKWPEADMC